MSRKAGDVYKDPVDGLYRKVIKLGPVLGVEVMHGYEPPAPKAKGRKAKPAWTPPVKHGLEMSPVVEKFLLWRYAWPLKRKTAGQLSPAQKDRLLRLVLVGKATNWYGNWRPFWAKLQQDGVTDAELKEVLRREFQMSGVRNRHDRRRAAVDCRGKGGRKTPWFQIGDDADPDVYFLNGPTLLAEVRRVMRIPVLTRGEAAKILADLDSIKL